MPTLHRERNFRFVIYPNDHEPSHIHALHPDGEVRINLGSLTEPPEIMTVEGKIKDKDVARAIAITEDYQEDWLKIWREIHG